MKFRVLILLVILGACNHFQTNDLETQFIYFKSAKYKVGNRSGFNKGDITDLQVSVDGVTLGLLRVPQNMAFNSENENAGIIVLPAVQIDANKSNSIVYPMLEIIEEYVPRNPLYMDTMDLVFDYKEDVVFTLTEGFEDSNLLNKDIDNNPNTNIIRSEDAAFEGGFSGQMHLTKEEPIIHIGSEEKIIVDKVFKGIFLELTYKNEVELFVGWTAKNSSNEHVKKYKLYLTPKDDWNTVYVDLTDDYFGAKSSDIRLAFGAELDTVSNTVGDIFIDNVKLLYY